MRTAAYALEGLAATAWMEGRLERAAGLYGAAAGVRESTEMPRLPAQSADHDPIERAVRDRLGAAAFAAAAADGRTASIEAILADE